MAKIPGVPITGQIVPTDTNDNYATHSDEYGKGGYRSITDVDARNNIPNERRKLGMKVYCIAEDQHFILKDTLDNSGWQVDQGGSGGVTDHDLLSNRGVNRHDDIDAFIYSKGAANGLVPLGADNKIPNQYIPALALMDTQFATNQAEMLALTAQKGDLCIRQDENKTYILIQEPATIVSNWTALLFPGSVVSVNGKTGIVAIGLTDLIDVTILNPTAKHTIVYNTVSGKFENKLLEVSDINDLVTQLANKSNVGHQHTLASITDYVSDITSRLSGKANTTHGHAISDITDLTTQLNAINTALSGKASTSHNHPISNITNLQTELNGKHKGLKIASASNITSITADMVELGTQLYIQDEDKYYKCIDVTYFNSMTGYRIINGNDFQAVDIFPSDDILTYTGQMKMKDNNIQILNRNNKIIELSVNINYKYISKQFPYTDIICEADPNNYTYVFLKSINLLVNVAITNTNSKLELIANGVVLDTINIPIGSTSISYVNNNSRIITLPTNTTISIVATGVIMPSLIMYSLNLTRL